MPSHRKITVNHRVYIWEVRDAARESLPAAEKVLVVRSEEGRNEFLFGLSISQNYTWIGPAFICAAEPEIFPSVEVGNYYLFPSFKVEKAGRIHGENVRSIVASLLNGRRLRKVNSHGLPPARPPIPRTPPNGDGDGLSALLPHGSRTA